MCIWETIYFKIENNIQYRKKEKLNKFMIKLNKRYLQNICTIGKELPQHTTDTKTKLKYKLNQEKKY